MLVRLLTAEESLREHTESQKALQKELSSQRALAKTLRASAVHQHQQLESCQVPFYLSLTDGATSHLNGEAQDIMLAAAAQPERLRLGRCAQARPTCASS